MDCVYIGAYSSDGPNLALRVARRPGRRAEVWLFLQVPGVGCLQHPVHPDTTITNADPNSFSAGGLRFDVVHPMKTWRVSFSGQLRWEHSGGQGCEQFLKENQTKVELHDLFGCLCIITGKYLLLQVWYCQGIAMLDLSLPGRSTKRLAHDLFDTFATHTTSLVYNITCMLLDTKWQHLAFMFLPLSNLSF